MVSVGDQFLVLKPHPRYKVHENILYAVDTLFWDHYAEEAMVILRSVEGYAYESMPAYELTDGCEVGYFLSVASEDFL